MAAEGYGVGKIQSRLYAEGIPSPRACVVWDRRVIRKIVASDEYRPLSFEEIRELVAPEVAARMGRGKSYGVQWYNRDKAITHTVSEPDGNGGRRYKKRKTLQRRPREEWLAIPVPTSARLPRELVDQARATMEANKGAERKHLAREWELRGVLRCSCGLLMGTHTSSSGGRAYHYYRCPRRNDYKRGVCDQRPIRADRIEPVIWRWFSSESKDPERIREGFDALIEHERYLMSRGDPEAQAQAWAEQIAECARLRGAYQDQQAAGLMTLEELGSNLAELEERRHSAERALADVRDAKERIEALENERDALIAAYAERMPEDLENLTGEARNTEYRRFEIAVTPLPGEAGGYKTTGVFCAPDSLCRPTQSPTR